MATAASKLREVLATLTQISKDTAPGAGVQSHISDACVCVRRGIDNATLEGR